MIRNTFLHRHHIPEDSHDTATRHDEQKKKKSPEELGRRCRNPRAFLSENFITWICAMYALLGGGKIMQPSYLGKILHTLRPTQRRLRPLYAHTWNYL